MPYIFERGKYWWLADGSYGNRTRYSLKIGDKRLADRILEEYIEDKTLRRFGLPTNSGDLQLADLIPDYNDTIIRLLVVTCSLITVSTKCKLQRYGPMVTTGLGMPTTRNHSYYNKEIF